MAHPAWRFNIDVGGTFADVVALTPSGEIRTLKLLSSGRIKGRAAAGSGPRLIVDPQRRRAGADLYTGYTLVLLDPSGQPEAEARVLASQPQAGSLALDRDLPGLAPGRSYELCCGEPAPVVAIRHLLGLRLGEPIGEVEVRLGTTRGTNALLERKGVPTALVTTRGFGDLLRIGTQDRPELFRLDIRKPYELFQEVVELNERLSATGLILRPLQPKEVEARLRPLRKKGIRALAVCFLHSYLNDVHERVVADVACEMGFEQISLSSRVSPTIKAVPRGDTTVADAYLTPVIRDYLRSIQACMPQARLLLLTSAGGLARPECFSAKDSILSGPAGGVVGYSRAARAAGFPRAIGFDMGGTSTDVSRFEGDYEYQFETRKAGIRIVTPMLAIETVAAGGGSLCAFDGQKLVVGPQSAGADPGPACYGRGGPLAVTDVNVFLGKIPPAAFPFPLDLEAVERRLRELALQVQAATANELSLLELAEGFSQIANARMAAAIKEISVAKGYDVRAYCLVSFGGAGGQHACAIARSLGIRTILQHPYAGVLSAYGIGLAEIKKFHERTVLQPCEDPTLASLEADLRKREAELLRQLQAEGLPEGANARLRRLLELRYLGQVSAITVESSQAQAPGGTASAAGLRAAFEERHRQLYGHAHPGRAVEIVTVRVEARGGRESPPQPAAPFQPRTRTTSARTPLVLGGQRLEAALFRREELEPGDGFEGPAIVVEQTGTLVLEPGWSAEVTGTGDLLFTDRQGAAAQVALGTAVDPIQLEVFHNHFASIAERMGKMLQRTAVSTNVKERLDFSCAVFTGQGELVANAPHIPVHLGAMSACVQEVLQAIPELAPGDAVVTNDPFRGGSHLPDVTVITPVHDSAGRLLFFTASRAHHAEIGGTHPGSMPPDSRCLAEEGVLIRPFKLLERGASREDRLRELLCSGPYPSRSPEENLADIRAQLAANQTGAADLLSLTERFGAPVVQAYMGHIRSAAEQKMRAALRRLPEGRYAFRDQMDDGTPIQVAITLRDGEAEIDFAGTGPVSSGNLNANPAIVSSAVLYVLRTLIDEDIPLNSGVLAPVTLRIPQGFLNPPRGETPETCAAVACGNVETSQRLVDVLFGALDRCAASQGTMNNLLFGDATFGYYETICGGAGAGPDWDGADAVHTHMTNTRLTDPEILESRYPIRLIQFQIRQGSGGAGLHKGGNGVVRTIKFLKQMNLSLLTGRRVTAPYGLHGGQPGAKGENRLRRAGESGYQILPWRVQLQVQPEDELTLLTPGGGGWGLEKPKEQG